MKKNKMFFMVIALILVLVAGAYVAYGYYLKETFEFDNPIVTMEVELEGEIHTIKMELYPGMAPNTVKNFIALINDGFYDGLVFHRVEEDLLIQGGDSEGTGSGAKEHSIFGEFRSNGYAQNTLKFERGVVGIARQDFTQYSSLGEHLIEEGYNSGYSQFFIMTVEMTSFNGLYAPFAKVIEGMDIVDAISRIETEIDMEIDEETGEEIETARPVNPPVIKKMTVETFGIEYKEPVLRAAFDFNKFLMDLYGFSF